MKVRSKELLRGRKCGTVESPREEFRRLVGREYKERCYTIFIDKHCDGSIKRPIQNRDGYFRVSVTGL